MITINNQYTFPFLPNFILVSAFQIIEFTHYMSESVSKCFLISLRRPERTARKKKNIVLG